MEPTDSANDSTDSTDSSYPIDRPAAARPAAAQAAGRGTDPDRGPTDLVSVRYMVDDVQESIDFYCGHLGFEVRTSAAPAFADVTRGGLRLLLSGPASSAGRPMPDGETPVPGGWNRIHLITDDLAAEVERLQDEGVELRNQIVDGPGGRQVLVLDPSGNVVELFQPAR